MHVKNVLPSSSPAHMQTRSSINGDSDVSTQNTTASVILRESKNRQTVSAACGRHLPARRFFHRRKRSFWRGDVGPTKYLEPSEIFRRHRGKSAAARRRKGTAGASPIFASPSACSSIPSAASTTYLRRRTPQRSTKPNHRIFFSPSSSREGSPACLLIHP